MLEKADKFLIERTTSIYLWLWDYTGVYVATLMAASVLIIFARSVLLNDVDFMGCFFLGFQLIMSIPYRIRQHRGDFKTYNRIALHLQEETRFLRKYGGFLIVTSPFILDAVAFFDPTTRHIVVAATMHVSSIACMTFMYLMMILLRDREPKSFFSRDLVMGGAS